MAIKIDAHMSAVAHHIIDGPVTFPYAVDAVSAVRRFPREWSHEPWSAKATNEALKNSGQPEVEITADEQAAIDAHASAVAEANERLKAFHEKKAAEKAEADQVARDEALVRSPAPRPEPRVKPLTPAQIRKRSAELTDDEQREADERIVREKAEQDRIAAADPTFTG